MTAESTSEQIRGALEKVLTSGEFVSSVQLSRFLRYIVETNLAGREGQLKESVIGVAVFNRGASYDPKTDPIVRVEARRLRARLEAYYQNGGGADAVRISLPKGGYCPSFEFVRPEPLPAAAPKRRRWWGLASGLAALAVAGVGLNWSFDSPVSRFWASLLEGDRPVLLIPADSGLVMLQNLARQPVSLADYISGEYRMRLAAQSEFDAAMVQNISGRRYTSIADLEFAAGLERRPGSARHRPRILYARDVRLADLNGSNVILLGARHSNPWVGLFEGEATFRIDDDERTSALSMVNLRPGPGEPRQVTLSPEELRREIYGIVTYHRNREGSGFALVVAGVSLTGTEAAADFVLDDSRLRPWLRKAESGGRLREFDILLRGRNLGGSAPSAEVVAFHLK